MPTLRSSSTSPFGRKVKVAAAVVGLADRVTIVPADTMSADDPLRRDNPLGKIPSRILADGTSVYDSRVIAEWLDHESGGGVLLPKAWDARLAVLTRQALADGIADAAVLRLYEGRFRPAEKHEPVWIAHQSGKMERGLSTLEANPPVASASPDIGVIAVACLLEWLDFRFKIFDGGAYPKLRAFLAAFNAARPDFAASYPKG